MLASAPDHRRAPRNGHRRQDAGTPESGRPGGGCRTRRSGRRRQARGNSWYLCSLSARGVSNRLILQTLPRVMWLAWRCTICTNDCPAPTADIGALLRNKRSGLLGTSGGFGSLGGSRPAPVAGGAHVPLAASFGNVVTAENPIYSPDDSLARAASKLQNLKAPQAPQPRPPSRAAQAQAAIAAAAAPPAGAASQPDASPEPAPERCESPQLIPAFPAAAAGEQQAPAPDGEGSHKGLRCALGVVDA